MEIPFLSFQEVISVLVLSTICPRELHRNEWCPECPDEKLNSRKSRFRMDETLAERHRHDSIVTVIILSACGSQPWRAAVSGFCGRAPCGETNCPPSSSSMEDEKRDSPIGRARQKRARAIFLHGIAPPRVRAKTEIIVPWMRARGLSSFFVRVLARGSMEIATLPATG